MKVQAATISLTSRSNKVANVSHAIDLVRKAAAAGADWVLLPEIFAWHGPYELIYDQAEFEDGPLNLQLAALAKELNIVLFAGSVGERPGPADLLGESPVNAQGQRRVFNTSYVFGRNGERIAKYRKTHLFNLIDAKGTRLYCEQDGFIPGKQHSTFIVDGFKCSLSICYDLRFTGYYQRELRDGPVDILVIPAAFTKKTGEAHWELLLRARAVEMQAYVYAANQTGEHAPGKESYGHSMVVDPWGIKLCDSKFETGFVMAQIDRERISAVRGQLPALSNRRPELY